jgi:Asp-tRNA(Asn)/Glu-tRNA(Gln) amidotransferase A subunit family amidase
MRFEEYRKHDAVSLAGLIAKRQVSAKEVLETAIARAEQVNPAINAIAHQQYEQACKAVAAGLLEGPLKGVPYLIKDLGFFETGEPATFGSSLFKDFVADHERGVLGQPRAGEVSSVARQGRCLDSTENTAAMTYPRYRGDEKGRADGYVGRDRTGEAAD